MLTDHICVFCNKILFVIEVLFGQLIQNEHINGVELWSKMGYLEIVFKSFPNLLFLALT